MDVERIYRFLSRILFIGDDNFKNKNFKKLLGNKMFASQSHLSLKKKVVLN